MNFKSNFVRRLPLTLAVVAAFGFAMAEPALATPDGKLGEPCTIHSGPNKGMTGIYKYELGGHGKLVCALPLTRFSFL
jgi:hypothetical protein